MSKELQRLKATYLKARQAYFLDTGNDAIMSDAEFDRLEATIAKYDPDWHVLKTTGHVKKTDVDLPEFMPSLSKVYNWQGTFSNKGYVITPKLDGTALLVHYHKGRKTALYTRGNGIKGGDVSYLLPLIPSLPDRINTRKRDLYLRCEGVMRKSVFASKWQRKSANELTKFKTARAAVNGQFNRTLQEVDPELLADVDVVVVGVYGERADSMLSLAKQMGFVTVPYVPHSQLSQGDLEQALARAQKGPYAVDGLVLTVKHAVFKYDTADMPAFATAFKKNDDGVRVTVERVVWQISRYGRYTPVIEIEPTDFDGVTVSRATAHNAKDLVKRGIGPGAVVTLVRSGEVIPFITSVVRKAKPELPVGAVWSGVHLYQKNANSKEQVEISTQVMRQFLVGLGIENVAEASLALLYRSGIKTLLDLLKLSNSKRLQLLSSKLGPKNGAKFNDAINQLLANGLPFAQFAAYSGVMGEGVGLRRIQMLSAHFPLNELLDSKPAELFAKIQSVPGFAETMARTIVTACRPLRALYREFVKANVKINVPTQVNRPKTKSGKYSGMVAVWTGYRSSEQEAVFTSNGGTVGSSINSKTTHVFYNPHGKFMAKVERAKSEGKQVYVWEDFCEY